MNAALDLLNVPRGIELRPYQIRIEEETRAHFRAGIKRVLIQLPTGGGKTALTADMFGTATGKGLASFFICHRRELVKQASGTFYDVGIPHGIVAAGFTGNREAPVQVCAIQTLANRLDRYKKPSLIAWDECHHIAAATWAKIFAAFPDAFHIGLSATPERLDGRGLDEYFDVMVAGPSTAELIASGFLSPYRLYAPRPPDLKGVHTSMGDFNKNEVESAMNKSVITGDAVSHYRRHADAKRAVVFAVSIKHSLAVCAEFQKAGYTALHIDGSTHPSDRDAAISAFKKGRINVLCNVDLFGEGFDLPAIEVAILLRPTKSLGLYLQQVGRVLRPAPGKSEAIILDHAGNSGRHGLPDDPRQWSLAGREVKKRSASDVEEITVKTCPECFRVVAASRPTCSCGYEWVASGRQPEQVDGELHEVKPAAKVNPVAAALSIQKRKSEVFSARTLEELIRIGAARGMKNPAGWASHIITARQSKRRFT